MCALAAFLPASAFAQAAEPSSAEPSLTQPTPATPAQPAAPARSPEPARPAEPAKPVITVGGYLEEYYQLQLQDASNRITNLYYLAEPASPGTGSVNASSGELWKYVQAANLTVKAPDDLVIEAGFEPNDIGTSSWAAVAGYVKLQLDPKLHGVVRGDYFYEKVAENNGATASAIFWPVTTDPATRWFVPNRKSQDTVTVGVTAWF